MNTYILLDSALVPSIWRYLAFEKLSFEPLYRYEIQKIKPEIPYIIKLDKERNGKVVNDILRKEAYHSGLIIQSYHTLLEIADKLGYFYHVINEKGEPFLQRFFELAIFPDFVEDLSEYYRYFLFSNETVFYYLNETKEFYQKISFQNNRISINNINVDYFNKEII